MAKKRRKIRRSKGRGSVSLKINFNSSQKKTSMILGNLLLSAILFVVSIGLYYLLSNDILKNFFWMLALIFGFVGLAFLMIYVIFVVKKILKK